MQANDKLLLVMAGAIAVSAAALVIMVILLGVMAKAVTTLKKTIDGLTPSAERALDTAQKALAGSEKQISDVSQRAGEILDSIRDQVKKSDDFVTLVTTRARMQFDRVELILEDTLSRVDGFIVVLNKGVRRPLSEVSGVTAGIRAGINHLLRGGRPNVAQATSDEEMFI